MGDGDSNYHASVFETLKKAPPSYSCDVQKDECVGHIQKRIGTAPREYKKKNEINSLADEKSVSGNGRLTDVVINRI